MKKISFLLLFFIAINAEVNTEKFKVGLCVTATNKYIKFLTPLLRTAKLLFLPKHDVHFFIFTDQHYEFNEKTKVIKIQHQPWPFSTMMRFKYYMDHKHHLNDMNYLFACDADMLFMNKVEDEILSDLVVVLHPYFWNNFEKGKLEYETNPISKASINNEGKHYFAGGFYGGKRKEFFKLLEQAVKNIEDDLKINFIAKWHDESHLNRYCATNPPSKILNCSYCYPQYFFNHPQKDFNFKKILVALEKDHNQFRY